MDKEKNIPEKKFSTGAVSAVIWRNLGKDVKTGDTTEFRSIVIDRRYKDKESNWQATSSLRLNDLPKAILILQKAYEYLVLKGEASPSSEILPGGDELIIEEDEEEIDESNQSSLLEFKPAAIKAKQTEADYDASVMLHLSKKTAQEILTGMRKGHPDAEFGEPRTWRSPFMDECKRRGKQLLLDLGWPVEMNSLYANLHTGGVETLEHDLNDLCHPEDRGWNHVWAVAEHSEPLDSTKPNWKLIKYEWGNIQTNLKKIENLKGLKTADEVPGGGCESPATLKKYARESIKYHQESLDEEMKRCLENNIEINIDALLCKTCKLFLVEDKNLVATHSCVCNSKVLNTSSS